MKHLWEVEHPYYCNEDNYYARESVASKFDSWDDFMSEFGDSDMDYNLVFRWDWQLASEPDLELEHDRLLIFFMGQRKGLYYYSEIINIKKEDEPSVREWLQTRFNHLLTLWAPISEVPS